MKLIVILLAVSSTWAGIEITETEWRTVFLDTFTAMETLPSESEIICAAAATQLNWVRIYRFELNSCKMSSKIYLPNATEFPGSLRYKTNVSPFDYACLLSNGSLIENGTQWTQNGVTASCINGEIETEEPTTVPPATSCPSTFQNTPQGCLQFNDDGLSWFEAQTACETSGAGIASPDLSDLNAIQEIATEMGSNEMWIGVSRESYTAPFILQSAPGKPTLANDAIVWDKNYPKGSESDPKSCVAIKRNKEKLINNSCELTKGFICEIPGFRT